jgi:hypothetical protein
VIDPVSRATPRNHLPRIPELQAIRFAGLFPWAIIHWDLRLICVIIHPLSAGFLCVSVVGSTLLTNQPSTVTSGVAYTGKQANPMSLVPDPWRTRCCSKANEGRGCLYEESELVDGPLLHRAGGEQVEQTHQAQQAIHSLHHRRVLSPADPACWNAADSSVPNSSNPASTPPMSTANYHTLPP